ncbi:hypothetical protein [Roseomonas indoligenes]|uniref:Argininosuccinate lyase n=1 Tax=Roseomonas indoligenes TaxID=2820811 RepID=A0A940MW25_9PROT|nr:hypothetical protein [Pararoseomonas indoligenes]MBP0491551.1 hypothetical protein [Pararoseomonas indoligenes]
MIRRLVLPALLAPLALASLAAPAAAQSRLDFSLVNRTGYEINEVYVSSSASSNWGSDVLGQGTLVNGNNADIRFSPGARGCQWDIKVVYTDGDETEWSKVNLCNISRITLFWNRQAGTTRAVTE